MRQIYPTYYGESVDAAYPFEAGASRTNGTVTIEDDILVDGRLFPPDGRPDLYIDSIEIGTTVRLTLANGLGRVASAEFERASPPAILCFYTDDGMYVGLLQGYDIREIVTDAPLRGFAKLTGWPDGTHAFSPQQTRLCASVVVPQPQPGVRRITLRSGAVFADDVWLVGEHGVQLTVPSAMSARSSSSSAEVREFEEELIRVDVVGDPLHVRRACDDSAEGQPPEQWLRSLVLDSEPIYPDASGGLSLLVGTQTELDRPALRIRPTGHGLIVEFVGS